MANRNEESDKKQYKKGGEEYLNKNLNIDQRTWRWCAESYHYHSAEMG